MRYLKFEIKNTLSNIFAIIFGIVFPNAMILLIYFAAKDQVGSAGLDIFAQTLLLRGSLMIPLALIFVGFAALFSQETEKRVTLRMILFGYTMKKQLVAKFLAQCIVATASITLYLAVCMSVMQVAIPSLYSAALFFLSIFLMFALFFILAFSIAMLAKRFSLTYGITMCIYFSCMILSGMMGIEYDQLPRALQYVSNLLPTTQLPEVISEHWSASGYNIASLAQSFLFLGGISILVLLVALHKNKPYQARS